MKFINLTMLNENKIIVNLDKLKTIYVNAANQTIIHFGKDDSCPVKESQEEISAIIELLELIDKLKK